MKPAVALLAFGRTVFGKVKTTCCENVFEKGALQLSFIISDAGQEEFLLSMLNVGQSQITLAFLPGKWSWCQALSLLHAKDAIEEQCNLIDVSGGLRCLEKRENNFLFENLVIGM